ncbi:hypothetical protein JW992_12540 [candidate division KSB1 bacterium]|nr:hypothetical protein [candidate division KSB1 bacterium]
MMSILSALREGLALNQKHIKIVPLIYAVNFFFALALAVPFFFNLFEQTARLGVRDDLLRGFSVEWWSTLELGGDSILTSLRPALASGFAALFDNLQLLLTGEFTAFGWWLFAFGLLYLVVSSFLNGGVIGLYADEKRTFSTSRFFSFAGFYFHHFIAITMTAMLIYSALYFLLFPALYGLVETWTGSWSSFRAVWWMNFAAFFVILGLVLLINMVMDYAKIVLVVEKQESAWMAIYKAVRFILAHPGGSLGLYLLLSGMAFALSAGFAALITWLHPKQVLVFLIVFTLQQVFITAKIYMRLNFYAAQHQYYRQAQSTVRKLRKV